MSESVAIDLDGVLGDTRPLWNAFLADAARRFASIAELDPASISRDRGAASAELDAWAAGGVGDWRRALERFAEDNAPVHLRPDAGANETVRRLKRAGVRVVVFTDAPEPLARVALAHLGLARSVDTLDAERPTDEPPAEAVVVRDAEALGRLDLRPQP